MDFREIIRKVVDGVNGGLGGALMGADGIPVATYVREDTPVAMDDLGAELSSLLQQLGGVLDPELVGTLQNLWLTTDRMKILVVNFSEDYFLVFLFEPDAYMGQCLFNVNRQKDQILAELA